MLMAVMFKMLVFPTCRAHLGGYDDEGAAVGEVDVFSFPCLSWWLS